MPGMLLWGVATATKCAARLSPCQQRASGYFSCNRKPPTCRPCVRLLSVSNNLIQVLKDELKFQTEDYRPPEEIESGPPKPFKLDEMPGKTGFQLKRTYGKEDITIFVSLDKQPPVDPFQEEAEDEELYSKVVAFEAAIYKGNKTLQFSCESDGESVTITHMGLHDSDAEEEEDGDIPAYSPVFEELDDTVKQAFTDYLEERGITAELGHYMLCLCDDKIAIEYMTWLRNVRDFLAQ